MSPPPPERWLYPAHWPGADGRLVSGAIGLRDGRLLVCPGGTPPAEATQVLDCSARVILPGLVDPHVHLREPGQGRKEGVANGTRAALAGGVTTVLDMPNNRPPVTTASRLEAKRALFRRKSHVHWGLFQQGTARGPVVPLSGVAGVKLYLARSSALPAIAGAQRLAKWFAAADRVAVHAESETRFLPGSGPHHETRPTAALAAGLALVEEALLALPRPSRPRVILCHATGRVEVEWLQRMKGAGHDVWGETAPHYLLLSERDYQERGARLQVNPPLRPAVDQEALWQGLSSGAIDFIGTDHAPHQPAEKEGPMPPSGMPGIEWLGPWLFTLAESGRLSWSRVLDLGCRNAARCYGLPAGGLESGRAADLVLYERTAWQAGSRPVLSRAGYCPYPTLALRGRVTTVFAGGRLKYDGGTIPDPTPGKEVTA